MRILVAILIAMSFIPVFAQSVISFDVDMTEFTPGQTINLSGSVDAGVSGQPVSIEVKDGSGNVILIRTVSTDESGNFELTFKIPETAEPGDFDVVANVEIEGDSFSEGKTYAGAAPAESGGGCLIATATYGSELAPQVQTLREIRDNSLLGTESGTNFMNSFNEFYYSFSPAVADYERENPAFREAVKLALTPMIASLSILNYVDMNTETEVLGYGITLIALNIGMYFVAPAVVISRIRK
jgi:hypothetical protein